jgi:hypothetical protein
MVLRCAFAALVLAQTAGWQTLSKKDGVRLDRREVKDSNFYEYRAVAETDAPVDALCDKVFEWGTTGLDHEGLKARKLLKDTPDERIVYDQVEQAVVSTRDYTMVVRRQRDGDSCRIRFETTTDLAPKPVDGYVRIDKMHGGWDFEPKTQNKTKVTYTIYADPGGSVPAFLVNSSQRDITFDSIKKGIAKSKGEKQ